MTVTPTDDWAAEFAAICDAHRGRLVRWLTAVFGPRHAEDIAQEALTRLYVRPGMLHEDADAWPWLAVVARNVGRDLIRRDANTVAVESDVLEQLAAESGVHDTVAARDDAVRLARALRRISPRDRMLLQLRDVDGLPVADIAERLRTNDNAVRQQVFRARRRLASAYLAQGGERRTGLVALLGLKAREVARRFAHPVELAGPSAAGVLNAVAPFVALLAGGGLGWAAADPAPPVAVAPLGDSAPGTGLAGHDDSARSAAATAAARGTTARRGGRSPDPASPSWVEVDKQLGPVRVNKAAARHHPLRGRTRGEHEVFHVSVDVPVVGRVEHSESEWTSGGSESRLCRVLDCSSPIPGPRPAGDPDPAGR